MHQLVGKRVEDNELRNTDEVRALRDQHTHGSKKQAHNFVRGARVAGFPIRALGRGGVRHRNSRVKLQVVMEMGGMVVVTTRMTIDDNFMINFARIEKVNITLRGVENVGEEVLLKLNM